LANHVYLFNMAVVGKTSLIQKFTT